MMCMYFHVYELPRHWDLPEWYYLNGDIHVRGMIAFFTIPNLIKTKQKIFNIFKRFNQNKGAYNFKKI